MAKLGGSVIRCDLAQALPKVNEAWLAANFTPKDQRDGVQDDTLSLSDELTEKVKAVDVIVIGAPVYKFSIPAALKAVLTKFAVPA